MAIFYIYFIFPLFKTDSDRLRVVFYDFKSRFDHNRLIRLDSEINHADVV
jgi:hypothetical protein